MLYWFEPAQNAFMYLRPYTESDFETLYALDTNCFAPRFRFSRTMMRDTVSASGAIVWLACDEGAEGNEVTLGFCAVRLQLGESSGFAYVATLDVAPENRGRGVGSALMKALESETERLGARWMVLHVYVRNKDAVRVYEQLGYQKVSRDRGFYGAGHDAWLYRKALGRAPEDGAHR